MTATAPSAPVRRPVGDVILETRNLTRTFQMGSQSLDILRGVNVAIRRGEFVAIEGRSGSGKSTLLHLMGLLDEPQGGDVVIDGRSAASMGSSERCRMRNRHIGFVFQFYHLLPELNVLQNTMLAAMVERSAIGFAKGRGAVRERAERLLVQMGLQDRASHKPGKLSGGERQRVAIARALMNEPRLLLADEPTGNLDVETGQQIIDVLNAVHANGQTVVMVTHDRTLARQADRTFVLRKGELVEGEMADG